MSIEMPRLDGKTSPSEESPKTSSSKNSNVSSARVKKIALAFLIVGAALVAGGCGIMGYEDVLVHMGSSLPFSIMDAGTAVLIGGFASVATGIAYSVKKYLEIKKQMKKETVDEVVDEIIEEVLSEVDAKTADVEIEKRLEKRAELQGVFQTEIGLGEGFVGNIFKTFFPQGIESFEFDKETKDFSIKLHKPVSGKILSKGWYITEGASLTVKDRVTGHLDLKKQSLFFDKDCITIKNSVDGAVKIGVINTKIKADVVVADLLEIQKKEKKEKKDEDKISLLVGMKSFVNGTAKVGCMPAKGLTAEFIAKIGMDKAAFSLAKFVDSFGKISW
jgi:hypothetical protein